MQVQMRFDGFAQMRTLLTQLPRLSQERVMRPPLRQAARWMAQAVEEATPEGETGDMKAAAGYVRQERDTGLFTARFKVGYKSPGGAAAILNDQGTQQRATKAGANRGVMIALLFFDKAIEAASKGALLLLQNGIAQKLAIECARFAQGRLNARGGLKR